MSWDAGKLECDMTQDCQAPVTHIDNKGYAYCQEHGLMRQSRPCRKLRGWELRRLERGLPLTRY